MTARRGRFPVPLHKLAGGKDTPARELLRPQRPLAQAARDAAAQATPTGVGLDSAAVRARMVQRLQAGGLQQPAVLAALAAMPRHLFVDAALVPQAYEDTSLPIGHGQTISKPSVVGRMLALLMDGRGAQARGHLGRVLEVGSGCGYQAALLAQLGSSVVSVERLAALAERARSTFALPELRGLRSRVHLLHADGMHGHAPRGPYDSIIAAAGGEQLPPAWLEQLAVGGRLVAPVAGAQGQVLVVVDRDEQGCHHRMHEGVHFVPLKSGVL